VVLRREKEVRPGTDPPEFSTSSARLLGRIAAADLASANLSC
jgi:hypothetical protein